MTSRREFLLGVGAAAVSAAIPAVAAGDILTVEHIVKAKEIFLNNDRLAIKMWAQVLERDALKYLPIWEESDGR